MAPALARGAFACAMACVLAVALVTSLAAPTPALAAPAPSLPEELVQRSPARASANINSAGTSPPSARARDSAIDRMHTREGRRIHPRRCTQPRWGDGRGARRGVALVRLS